MNVVDHIRVDAEAGARRLEREYKDRLLTVAKRLCPDAVEAEALVWRTLDEAVRHIESLVDPQALFSWMCGIMVRGHSMANRRKINRQIVYTDELPDLPDGLMGVERILQGVDGDILRKAIDELPPKLKETIILRYFMDLPLLTIAKILAVPKGTISSRLHMARMVLAVRLGVQMKKPAVALVAAALFLLAATAAVVVGVGLAGRGGDAVPDAVAGDEQLALEGTQVPDGTETTRSNLSADAPSISSVSSTISTKGETTMTRKKVAAAALTAAMAAAPLAAANGDGYQFVISGELVAVTEGYSSFSSETTSLTSGTLAKGVVHESNLEARYRTMNESATCSLRSDKAGIIISFR